MTTGCTFDRVAQLYPHVDEKESPLPRCWSQQDKFTYLGLSQNNLRVHYKGVGKNHKDAASVRTAQAIPAACGLYYFEIKVVSKGRDGYIGIGLCAQGVSMNKLPGWEKNSYGYHADDGNSFCSSSPGEAYGPTFTTNDVIGCGLNFIDNTCFYTKNGINLGIAFRDLVPNLHPTIGLQTVGEIVDANFGQHPFMFDIEGMRKELMANTSQVIDNFPVVKDNATWQVLMQRIVADYLVHHGFCSTAEAFAKSTGQSITEDFASIKNRQRIQKLILAGKVSEAIDSTNSLYPTLLSTNLRLLFQLKCRQFIEMVNGCDGDVRPVMHSPTRSSRNSPSSSARNSPSASPCRTMSHASSPSAGLLIMHTFDSSARSTHVENGSTDMIENGVDHDLDACVADDEDMDQIVSEAVTNGTHENETMDTCLEVDTAVSSSYNSQSQLASHQACSVVQQQRASEPGPSLRQLCGGNLFAIEKLIVFGKSLQASYEDLVKELGEAPESESLMKEAFSLLAYSNPRESPVGYLLDPSQRESACAAVNSAILDFHRLPARPVLELAIGQSKACLRTMAKHGIGACAFVDIDAFVHCDD